MIKGVLLDMDGVLINTEHLAGISDVLAAQKMGYTLPEEVARQFVGANEKLCKRIVLGHFGPHFDFERFKGLMLEEMEHQLEAQGGPALMPGVADTLGWIYQQGLPMCVASSTHTGRAERYLKQARIRPYFTAVIGGDKVPRSKPEPDIFIAAAKALSLPPALCLAVEDSYNGVHSAAAAGCITVMIPDLLPPNDEMRGAAAAILDSMKALPGFIRAQTAIKPN
jgi:HAD superfamily hydrolase (TIGR01509 family)